MRCLLAALQKLIGRQWQFWSIAVVILLPTNLIHAEDAATRLASEVSLKQESGKVVVTIGGEIVATYVYADSEIPRPYFAHVHGPGGVQLTRNFPPIEGQDATDHDTMHPGIWMAFGDLNGTDIWRNKGRVVHQRFLQPPTGGIDHGSFAVENRYETAGGQPICQEDCRLTFLVRPLGYLLLWDSTFSSDGEFSFGDQEEMGLGVRMATSIAVTSNQGGRLVDSEGRNGAKEIWGKTADWCDYSGPSGDFHAGITLMPHPDNFRSCWWHARDYGFVAANPFGRSAMGAGAPSKVIVRGDAPLRLRFGLMMYGDSRRRLADPSEAYRDYLKVLQSERREPKPAIHVKEMHP